MGAKELLQKAPLHEDLALESRLARALKDYDDNAGWMTPAFDPVKCAKFIEATVRLLPFPTMVVVGVGARGSGGHSLEYDRKTLNLQLATAQKALEEYNAGQSYCVDTLIVQNYRGCS